MANVIIKSEDRRKDEEHVMKSYGVDRQDPAMREAAEIAAARTREAFWKIFKDYEELDGNGHVHSEVQPAMRNLEVIPMHEVEKISELMHSRR